MDLRQSRSGLLRPPPAEVRAALDPLTGPRTPGLGGSAAFLAGTAVRTDGLARSRDPAAVAWVQRLRRKHLRAGS